MTRRSPTARIAAASLVVAVALGISTATASASTFFVATGGNDGNNCTSAGTACLTIAGAITKARAAPDTATINIGAGTFAGNVALDTAADSGTSLVGAGSGAGGTVIQGIAGDPTVTLGQQSSGSTLSHLKVLSPAAGSDAGVSAQTIATLTDVAIEMHTGSSGSGLSVSVLPVTFEGGSVTMQNGSGAGISSNGGELTVRSSTVTVANGATGNGITGSIGELSVRGSTVNIGNTGGVGISGTFGDQTITDTTVNQGSNSATGINSALAAATLTNVDVTMSNAADTSAALNIVQSTGTLDDITVVGAWKGPGLLLLGSATLRDSRMTSSAAATSPLILSLEGGAQGRSLLIQRSALRQTAAGQIAVQTSSGEVTLDSSQVLGGQFGVLALHTTGKTRTVTVAGSTIDAGTLGTRDALPGTSALYGSAAGGNSTIDIRAQGSILVDSQTAIQAGPATR